MRERASTRAEAGDADARLAFDVYAHRIVDRLGGCVAALGGLDVLVFTGGVGRALAGDPRAGGRAAGLARRRDRRPAERRCRRGEITAAGAAVRTFVVQAAEDLPMAAEAGRLLHAGQRPDCHRSRSCSELTSVAMSDSECSSTASAYSRGTPATASVGITTW